MDEMRFKLEGEMPSKKNGWKPKKGGGSYIPADMQAELDDFLWQLKAVKIDHGITKPLEGSLSISASFYVPAGSKTRDLDNMLTTLQDLLQKGGIIKNDKDINHIEAARIVQPGKPYVGVILSYHGNE